MDVVVVGGGAAGQFSSLLLARAGHRVTLLDRDDLRPAPDVETAAATAFRPAAPQVMQPHIALPRFRLLLQHWLPDVYEALLNVGAVEAPLTVAAPAGAYDGPRAGDDDYTSLATRRSTLDLVLGRAVRGQQQVAVHYGVRVGGLLAALAEPPRIVGVRTDRGDFRGDFVVDASGRRTAIDTWLAQIGARQSVIDQAECGLAYHSRHYRIRPDAALPGHPATRIVLALDEFTTGIWGSDNGTALIAIAPLVEDKRFRAAANEDVFSHVVRMVPPLARWLDVLQPITGVLSMGGLHNTMRSLVVDGAPVATGIAVVGDSLCTTNPTFGRGLALALQTAADLAAALDSHTGDDVALARLLDDNAREHVLPYFVDQASNDGARLATLRHTLFGVPLPAPRQRSDRVTFPELRNAMPYDGAVLRAFWRVMGMLSPPEQVYTDPEVVTRTFEVLQAHPPQPPPQPTRADLDAVLLGRTSTPA